MWVIGVRALWIQNHDLYTVLVTTNQKETSIHTGRLVSTVDAASPDPPMYLDPPPCWSKFAISFFSRDLPLTYQMWLNTDRKASS